MDRSVFTRPLPRAGMTGEDASGRARASEEGKTDNERARGVRAGVEGRREKPSAGEGAADLSAPPDAPRTVSLGRVALRRGSGRRVGSARSRRRTVVVGGGEVVARGSVAPAHGEDGVLRDLLHAKRVLEPGHLRGRGDVGGSVGGVGADGHAASGAAGGAGARAEAARAEENGVKRAIGAATQHAVVRAGDRRAAFLKSFRRTMFSVISRDSSRRSALHRRGRSLGSSPFPSAVETRSPAAPPSSLVPARARSGRPRSRCRASPPASRGSRFARARRGRSFPAPADPPLPGSSSAPLGTLAAARARRLGARAPRAA